MANAKKCDICGEFYAPYEEVLKKWKIIDKRPRECYISIECGFIIDELSKEYTTKDFCKECVKEIIKETIDKL